MNLSSWLHVWQVTAVVVAVLDIAALCLLVWLGSIDEREHPEPPTFSPRQLREAQRGTGWDRARTGPRSPR